MSSVDNTVAWKPNPLQGMKNNDKLGQILTSFVTNLIPHLIGPDRPRLSPDQVQCVVTMFQTEFQAQLASYAHHNSLGADIQELFKQGQRGGTPRQGSTTPLADSINRLFRDRKRPG